MRHRKATHVRIAKGRATDWPLRDDDDWELYALGERIHSGSRGHEYRCLDGEGRVVRVCAAMGDRDADHGDGLYTSGETVRFVRLEPARLSVCGTRAVVLRGGDFSYRVVCATCGGGGSLRHRTESTASSAMTRDSSKPCKCGAR